jgi:uncharacterized membrane protein
MDSTLFFFGIFLTIVPLIELRGGLPVVLVSIKDSSPLWLILAFILVVLINILLIFFIFFFLEKINNKLLRWNFYKKHFSRYLLRIQKKSYKISSKKGIWVFVSLFFFVAIPLPLTGAYTGTVLAWFLKLDKKKSIVSIALGVLSAGIIVFLVSNGIISFF